mmetsp:Transcript_7132/g.17210  ORF Transcript_7132/g.17210 Transcript_7132/m.17210 type:complete len:201 (-) Transcript_7132:153-755(-)|eukprot:CAMPEP_0201124010 /NCGR_PEP_ID=MMETSP0850-20130426/9902_1 /ASSEMBLY_ACC=CAM_ASM_000622 /TAXON_ID=183588 /ORGANISM="Pseudo-nitzschia fraudulenta, Strain WWA7" /LENGTH=200 /DNA_ID=CAMNT_0047391165 /DNA_START=56 /DNA_END=658 /DNA_ORIENTATION=+
MPPSQNIVVEVVEEKHLDDVGYIRGQFLNSKRCCFCILPLGLDSKRELKKTYTKYPEMMQTAAVATLPDKGVVGFIQVKFEGMHTEFKTVRPGEAYVYMLAVLPEGRGMGVGTALLNWAETLARDRGCTFMALEVINGNPALGLYERKGYVKKPQGIVSTLFQIPFMACLLGVVICPRGSSNYCSYGVVHYMEKPLQMEH